MGDGLKRAKKAAKATRRGAKERARVRANRATDKIITYLFVNGQGEEAERLVLTSKDGRDLGGYSKFALIPTIWEIIRDALVEAERQTV